MRDPNTKKEWIEALIAAEAMLALHSARAYGLVTGGPAVDAERCVYIIDAARQRGHALDSFEKNRAVAQLITELQSNRSDRQPT